MNQPESYILEPVSRFRTLGLKCPKCVKANYLPTKADLLDHLRTVHQFAPFRCRAVGCKAASFDEATMSRHSNRIHRHNRLWQCPHCSKTFALNSNCAQHIYRDHERGRFECAQPGCTYTVEGEVRVVMVNHSKLVHHPCIFPGCSARLPATMMRAHARKMHGQSKIFYGTKCATSSWKCWIILLIFAVIGILGIGIVFNFVETNKTNKPN